MSEAEDSSRRVRAGHRHAQAGGAMKRQWCVHLEVGEDRIEADEVEITGAGVLAFYRYASRQENERTLLVAFSPDAWRRCELDGDRL